MSNTKVENMIDKLIEMSADPELPLECVEAMDGAIQSLVDNSDVNKSYYFDLSPEEIQANDYIEILFQNILRNSIAIA